MENKKKTLIDREGNGEVETEKEEIEAKKKLIAHYESCPNLLKIELDLISADKNLEKIDHLSKIIEKEKNYDNPSLSIDSFVYPLTKIQERVLLQSYSKKKIRYFLKGGPRRHIHFNTKNVVPVILTCGGLCPGLNVVIREVTYTLLKNYNVKKVFGIQYGYKGFYTYNWLELDLKNTRFIHKQGGTILGSSRGGFDLKKIMKKIIKHGANQIYIIGGDGTQRGAHKIYEYCKEHKLNIGVCGLPKTIDNDIIIIDRSFGYQTAVDEAIRAINSAESEAFSAEYGVGLVKLMGRSAGHIALEASLSQRGVDILLIPEVKYELGGKKGLLSYILKYLLKNHKCIIVVAEGAGESMIGEKVESKGTDKSGNVLFGDIGLFLKNRIVSYCKKEGLDVTLKYIDPTYMIRSLPSNPYDTQICAQLGYQGVNGLMAGFTGFCVGQVNHRTAYIPLDLVTKGNRTIHPKRSRWQRFLANTGMPSFINDKEIKKEIKEEEDSNE